MGKRDKAHRSEPTLAPARRSWPYVALIFVATFVVYFPALRGEFLWDDLGHVTRADLRSLSGLWRIWTEVGATQQYYPVLHSAFWLEHRVWGDAVLGYHLLNIVLHAASACLFARVLQRLAIPGAWLAALLFALHPVCVESVAWISEQKNTLSTVFYLAAAIAYLRFAENFEPETNPGGRAAVRAGSTRATPPTKSTTPRSHLGPFPGAHGGAPSRGSFGTYLAATAFLILALLTKTVTATLPAALLVVCWFRRGRIELRRDVVPLVPWFLFAGIFAAITSHFERVLIGAQGADFQLSAVQRVLLAGRIFCFYLGKLVWPTHLIFIYPRWKVDPTALSAWLFPLAAVLLFAVLLWRRRRGALAAALLFAGTLFPALGFFNVFPFLYSYVADHFQYLATFSVFALASAGLVAIGSRFPEWLQRGAVALLAILLGVLSWKQAHIYQNVFALYESTLAGNPTCWMAHNNLAIALADAGRIDEAVPHLQTAIALKPDFAPAENNLGDDYVRENRVAEAIPHFERAVQLQPNYAVAHRNLGMALAMTDHLDQAVPHFARAVEIDPDYVEAELDWGMALVQTGTFGAAVPHLEHVLEREPNSTDARHALEFALQRLGRSTEAQRFDAP